MGCFIEHDTSTLSAPRATYSKPNTRRGGSFDCWIHNQWGSEFPNSPIQEFEGMNDLMAKMFIEHDSLLLSQRKCAPPKRQKRLVSNIIQRHAATRASNQCFDM